MFASATAGLPIPAAVRSVRNCAHVRGQLKRPAEVLQETPEDVFGHGGAQFGATDPGQLVSPAGQHPAAQVVQRHRLKAQIDVLSGARQPAVNLALLHRPLGRAGEHSQLARP